MGNLLHICGHGFEDLVCGFVPGEGFGVVVPVVGPGVDGSPRLRSESAG